MSKIAFHREGGRLPPEPHDILKDWIERTVRSYGGTLGELTYIFCSDDYLHALNIEHLGHDTLTDIITFPSTELPEVAGDLFISTERVAENARAYGERYADELHRVMIHGVLHLCGLKDKTEADREWMREAEDRALAGRPEGLVVG